MLYLAATRGPEALKSKPGAEPGSVAAIPPELRGALAWAFPAGYAAGFVFAVTVFRLVAGRGWTREVGLNRLPARHLGLGLLVLPGFVVLSDWLAQLLSQWIDPVVFRVTGLGGLGDSGQALQDTFSGHHWSFAVLAIGVGPGIVEEVWCRGFLSRGLVGRYGWAAGVTLTSLFFGALHLWPPSYVLTTAAMGACLHYTYTASRSLWVPITIHLVNNSFGALSAVKAIPTEPLERAGADHPVLMVVLAACLLLAAGTAMWTVRPPGDGDEIAGASRLPEPGGSWLPAVSVAVAVGSAGALFWLILR
jgi:membrane protease YdiL (CAAX protease family)